MKSAFYAGTAGMIAQQRAMDTVGNNIANISTNGYQKQNVSFESLLHNEMYVNAESDPLVGVGARAIDGKLSIDVGSVRDTGNELDFAITTEGFFKTENNGEMQFTRNGAFTISIENGSGFLTTSDGAYVLDKEGDKIEIEVMENSQNFDLSGIKDQIGVYVFSYGSALTPVGANKYVANELTGEETALENSSECILQRVLNETNVNLTDEMANLISVQRAFQVCARVVTVADENEQAINNLRK